MNETKTTNPKDAAAVDRLPLHLCPATLEIFATLAFVSGAVKYDPHNWREAGVSAAVYYDACRRHLNAWFNGEDDDPDEKVPHLAAAAACLAVLLDAAACGKLNDDRIPAAPIGALQRALPARVRAIREATAAVVARKKAVAPPECSCDDIARRRHPSMCWHHGQYCGYCDVYTPFTLSTCSGCRRSIDVPEWPPGSPEPNTALWRGSHSNAAPPVRGA